MKKTGQKTVLTEDDVKHIAKLANLPLTEAELKKITPELAATVTYIDAVKKINTHDVKETSHTTKLMNVFREDTISSSLSQKDALSNAVSTHNGYFKVKAVMEE